LARWVTPREAIYNKNYFARVIEPSSSQAAPVIAATLLRDLTVGSVVDVGCGTGALLSELKARGCSVYGLEFSEAAIEYCRMRHLVVRRFDLEQDVLTDDLCFDCAVSMEVAEHLAPHAASHYVNLLTRLGRIVVFTAAPPGQGGTDHVNEQPATYWIAQFASQGYTANTELAEAWKREWRGSNQVARYYWRNLMVFERGAATGTPER